jgi:hypothetical protein
MPELDETTFYLHCDIAAHLTLPEHRRVREDKHYKPSIFRAILRIFFA